MNDNYFWTLTWLDTDGDPHREPFEGTTRELGQVIDDCRPGFSLGDWTAILIEPREKPPI